VKRRSKLKQIRLHLNEGITRAGFATLNDIFKQGYIRKKDQEAAILIDGFFENLELTNKYKQWLAQKNQNKAEFAALKRTITRIEEEHRALTQKLTNRNLPADRRVAVKQRRKALTAKKQELIHRSFELNDKMDDDNKEPMEDPKRDPNWDRRLMTNWSAVWDRWTSMNKYKNFTYTDAKRFRMKAKHINFHLKQNKSVNDAEMEHLSNMAIRNATSMELNGHHLGHHHSLTHSVTYNHSVMDSIGDTMILLD